MVDWDEEIKAHLFWVWKEGEGFLGHGKECMLVVTDKRIAVITKTDMTVKMHDTHSLRQARRFQAGENIFRPAEGYKLEHLERDLDKSADNLEIPFGQILDISSEEKSWGTVLKVIQNLGDKTKTHKFSIAKGWVKYPAKDPMGYLKVDWSPIINLVKTST
ncbi:MAG TPA: hypothetical protein VNI77_10740 [Nitrososphaera sp.]|nr:hypothetical protein [Nitrososphaera sp.]